MTEQFNEEAAKNAVSTAVTSIDALCQDFRGQADEIAEAFARSGGSIGGLTGEAAANSFSVNNETKFSELKTELDSFMTRIDEIIKVNVSTTEAVNSIYSAK